MTDIGAEFPFAGRHADTLDGARMHFICEGDGRPVVFLHGNPTSSYLWRNVILGLQREAPTPLRAIAPDLIGMGRSDKPQIPYRFVDHARYLDRLFEVWTEDGTLPRGERIVIVGHDWGSALGFHWAHRHPERVAGLAFMEFIGRPVSWDEWPADARRAFEGLRAPQTGEKLIYEKNLFVERILPGSILRQLSEAEMERYREPFRQKESRLPTLQWPREIPIDGEPADVHAIVGAYAKWLAESEIPKLMLTFEPGAIVTPPVLETCRSWPNLREVMVGAASHFVQEDCPDAIAAAIATWLRDVDPWSGSGKSDG